MINNPSLGHWPDSTRFNYNFRSHKVQQQKGEKSLIEIDVSLMGQQRDSMMVEWVAKPKSGIYFILVTSQVCL